MWLILFVGSAVLVVIAAFFKLSTYFSRTRNRKTPSDVAGAIEGHLEGTEEPWDWDTFTSVPIANKKLDAIRLKCIELDGPLPLASDKREELEGMVQHLRDGDH